MLGRRNNHLLSAFLVLVANSVLFLDYAAGQRSCTTLNGRPGICIPMLKCKLIEEILRRAPRPLPNPVSQYIRRSYCGTFNGQYYTCCDQRGNRGDLRTRESPSRRQPVVQNGAEIRPGVMPTETLSRIGQTELNTDSAECNKFRILVANGKKTNLMEYPWLALLVYDDGVSKTLECGGSLISKRHVLTAAHCILVRKPKKLVAARLGEYDIRSEIDCASSNNQKICAPPIQEIDIAAAVYHKDYTPSRFLNDVGLLRLQREAVLNSAVQPICLPIEAHRKSLTTELTIAGWGNTERGSRANILQKAVLPVVENAACQNLYKVIPITDRHLCAGGVNATQSCRGDSGGPLFQSFERVQQGIVSGGSRKCGTNFPDVYTRVEPFIPWISSNIGALM